MKIATAALLALVGTAAPLASQPADEGRPGGKGRGDVAADPERPRFGRGRPREGDRHPPGGARFLAEKFMETHDRNKDQAVTFADEFSPAQKMAHLSEEGRRRIFDHLDKNKDGRITPDELPRGGPPSGGGKDGPPRGDLNKDGKLTFAEFSQDPRLRDADAGRKKAMFDRMDHNKDGVLTREDFRNSRWRGQGLSVDRGTLEKLDLDGDQALSFEEWKEHPRLKETAEDRLQELFGRLDRNGDGKLSEADRPERPRRNPPGGPPRKPGPE